MNEPRRIAPTGHEVDPGGVNHPGHYNDHPSGIEAIEVCRQMSFNLGNAFKYAYRARWKGTEQKDLEKCLWYLIDASLLEPKSVLYNPVPLEKIVAHETHEGYKELYLHLHFFELHWEMDHLFRAKEIVKAMIGFLGGP